MTTTAGARAAAGPETIAPPRSIEELGETGIVLDRAYRVPGARVLFADHERLCADFPWLSGREIDGWLLANAALASAAQVVQEVVNTPIPHAGPPLPVYRRPRGGRAFMVAVDDGPGRSGLLDLKGIGVGPGVTPRHGPYSDGLLALNEALEEIAIQLLVEAVFRHAGADYHALPFYAIVDLPFDVLGQGDRRLPACVLTRRAHRRPPGDLPLHGSVEQAASLEVELLLRRYGISSTGPALTYELTRDADGVFHDTMGGRELKRATQEQLAAFWAVTGKLGWRRFAALNVQLTRGVEAGRVELIDFGQYSVQERFEDPLLSKVDDRPFGWGGVILPGSPHWVQPDPALAIPVERWGRVHVGDAERRRLGASPDKELSRLELRCSELAHDVRAGRIDGGEVRTALERFVADATAHWPESS